MPGDISANLHEVRMRICSAAERAGRNGGEVKLVAVSKTHPPDILRAAVEAGATVFGENKVQEAEGKIDDLGRDRAEWHLIGHLQSNKARKAVQLFDVIHSVDSIVLAQRLERICVEEEREVLPVMVQVDLAGEETKSGIEENGTTGLAEFLNSCDRLRFDGLMVLPPFFVDPEATRPFFVRLRGLRDRLGAEGFFPGRPGELSMGMSHDFGTAIEEGATIVRVGTAIFGERGRAKELNK